MKALVVIFARTPSAEWLRLTTLARREESYGIDLGAGPVFVVSTAPDVVRYRIVVDERDGGSNRDGQFFRRHPV